MTTQLLYTRNTPIFVGDIDGRIRTTTINEVIETMDLYFMTAGMPVEDNARKLLVDYLVTLRDEAAAKQEQQEYLEYQATKKP